MQIALGDLQADRVTLWTQAHGQAEVEIKVGAREFTWPIDAARDDTAVVTLSGLKADHRYTVVVRAGGEEVETRFRTAPRRFKPLALAWSGDLGGQDICRDATLGYPITSVIRALKPDVFLAVGDLIYADGTCNPTGKLGNAQVALPGKAEDLAGYRAWWAYNLADAGFAALRAGVPQINVWDDHEVVNDFGPERDLRGGVHLMPVGEQAFREHNPMPQAGPQYRKLQWGDAAELFALDVRSYRSANDAPDDAAKTMLGATQKAWLVDSLLRSTATWKLVVSSSPVGPPSSGKKARDGWSGMGGGGGFYTELFDVFQQVAPVKNIVVLTTDLHFAAAYRYHPIPGLDVIELISGPMQAGLFPNRDVDPRLNPETLFFHGPESRDSVTTWAEALTWFNAGILRIDQKRVLSVQWVDANGTVIKDLAFSPSAG